MSTLLGCFWLLSSQEAQFPEKGWTCRSCVVPDWEGTHFKTS